jgi:hypothetical protein
MTECILGDFTGRELGGDILMRMKANKRCVFITVQENRFPFEAL